MDNVKSYIVSIIAVSIIAAVSINFTEKMGAVGKMVKLMCGILLIITVFSPVVDFPKVDISKYISDIKFDAASIIQKGQTAARTEAEAIIKAQSEAYILDKASEMGLAIEVDVTVSDSTPMIPVSVSVVGDVSPYWKGQLQQLISKNLGIGEECQKWR